MRLALFILVLTFSTESTLTAQASLSLKDGRLICIQQAPEDQLQVFVGEHGAKAPKNQPSVLGTVKDSAGQLIFTPLLPFGMQQSYTAYCGDELLSFRIPIPDNYQVSEVSNIYPRIDHLPANQLKFYIAFSRPMSTIAYPHIDLLDSNGQVIERALLKEIPELWDAERRLLCIWIEPGRIKQGLGPNQKLGPVLEQGKAYQLRIAAELLDQNGVSLSQVYTKRFTVVRRDDKRLTPHQWVVQAPTKNSTEAVVVQFRDYLDYGSSMAGLKVLDQNGLEVDGCWKLTQEESAGQFFPAQPWLAGKYGLKVTDIVEDLAGNTLNRLFDQPIVNKDKVITAIGPNFWVR